MSSSVFIESCPKPGKGALGADEPVISGSPDSNLVVVYGKSGVNFDQRGIENLIEEKTLSSISVIRLTSPTPSMIDEEKEAEKTEELLRRQAEGIFDDDSNDSRSANSSSADECEEHTESEELPTGDDEKSDGDENSADNVKLQNRKQKRRNRKKSLISTKIQNMQNKLQKERPDIVGLTIEEFYPPETAKEVVKEALKLAGVSTIKHTADYEFQLFVIKSDHCYTPFTSPSQMRAKLAEKYKAEKHAIIGRKIIPIPHSAITMKQIQLKKKVLQDMNDGVEPSPNHSEDDAEVRSSTAESDLDIISEESGDTDNDRDSDLDFDLNNRKGRKKKDLVTKAKRLSAGKVYVKRQLQTHDESDDQRNKTIRPVQSAVANRSNKAGVPSRAAGCAPIAVQKLLSEAVAALPPIPRRSATTNLKDATTNPVARQQSIPGTMRRGPVIEVGGENTPSSRTQLKSSPQPVKEIAINKVMASPKGGFTEIGELLSQVEKQTPTKGFPTTPTSSIKSPGFQFGISPSRSKGFMPLGIETAAKNKLPAQISIQTHQSSSELAAKNKVSLEPHNMTSIDNASNKPEIQLPQKEQISPEFAAEHFDLIVSIVKDEMQKTDLMKVTSQPNDKIPKLVKMLENAEQTLESNNALRQIDNSLSNFGPSADNTVDDIDISNAPLLDATEGDEIPDDLLQHVVDLIEDDETLQDAVQNQVFGGANNEGALCLSNADDGKANISSTITVSIPPTVAQTHVTQPEPNQPKSIIEMAISNIPSTPNRGGSSGSNTPSRVNNVQTSRSPLVRKEPIQIIRGNGRVITLPPIEAPTTRAKRRAQNQPITGVQGATANSSTLLNESSMDSSLQSNSSINVVEQPVHQLTVVAENKKEQSNKRQVSKESATSGASAKAKRSTVKKSNAAKNVNKNVIEENGAGSQEDDDDPNKLWCICRQPHNNRFMICCDVCEDWFHGTCVSITKAMGIEMEQKGIDWTCPKCIKLQEEKTQRKITDMLMPKDPTFTTSFERNKKFELQTSDASRLEAIRESVVDVLKNRNSLQKSDGLDIKQAIEPSKAQSGTIPPIKPPLKKSIGGVKVAKTAQKKKSAIARNKTLNNSLSQTKQRIPIQQQEQKIQMDHGKQSATIVSMPESQEKVKDLQKPLGSELVPTVERTLCIVCKKVARQNSIYCSDDCIRKHAQNALNLFAAASAAKPPEPPIIISANEEIAAKKKKAKGLFEDLLLMADRKPKVERVHVIERKTGRVLTGSNAPTTLNLKKWLQDNQTFEVVQPGSFQAQEIEKRQKQRHPQSLSPVVVSNAAKLIPQTPQNAQSTTQSLQVTPITKATIQAQKGYDVSPQVPKPVKQLVEQVVKTASNSPRPGTPKQLQKYAQQVSIKPDKATRNELKEDTKEKKEKSSKQRPSLESAPKKHPDSVTPTNSNSEPIRLNVRRTLKEQLLQRMNEPDSGSKNDIPKLSVEEIEKFASETEGEMYEYFSRDTGSRYRAKYRSLMFNIKDRKNHTLFAKICAKQIQPKQLVRMSPEELASQELAKWRENETKHQLEMIKKSELDLLSCTKNYVLKTHKGEEVIEGKSENCVNLDVTIPVEDVVSVLNSAVVSSSSTEDDKVKSNLITSAVSVDHLQNIEHSEIQSTKITNRSDEIKQKIYPKEKDKEPEREIERDRNRDHGRDRDRDREHSHIRARSPDSDRSREKQKKSRDKDRHRDKSRSRKRSRSHSRSRSRSREKRHKSHHREEKREKEERDREKDRYKEKERERDRESRPLKDESDKKIVEKFAHENSNKSNISNVSSKEKNCLKKPITTKTIESFSLIDQILESSKTVEEAANLISEKDKVRDKERDKEKQKQDVSRQANTPPLPSSSLIKYTPETNFSISSMGSSDDQEPSSTVSIATPPQDPYIRYAEADSPTMGGNVSSIAIWNGNINMVDVASFQIVLQPVVGNFVNIGSLLPDELDVVGRIGPDTVWEYISKIKRSPNKEIVIIRLIPASESETAAYTVLFQYLENRNRLGVISTVSPQIKDFYIYPLGAGKEMPTVLLPTEKVDFYEDPYRPDILVGVLVRIIGKRHSTAAPSSTSSKQKAYRRATDADAFTPPGSPKRKRRIHTSTPKVDEIDLDAIIKAPITIKSHKTPTVPPTSNDADEPYSPGGSSDDDVLLVPKTTGRSDEDELKRKMDELNRQIAAQEKEIAGLLNVESSCYAATSSSKTSAVLANISIPSNLSQILASIKSKPEGNQRRNSTIQVHSHQTVIKTVTKTRSSIAVDEEYNPEMTSFGSNADPIGKASSRLAQLSEAELLSMVPDGMMDSTHIPKITETKQRFEEPPPPGV
ncbi:uncharacterized protein pps isoform X2 [Eurosta solidaginis]|uniref:uncharacterized protein pps isoform X2 n=1 Tax=Eurosta solidaginis TaxID=178769 RepID=UPI00353154B3